MLFAGDADRVALDLRLDLGELVADQLGDLLGELVGQARAGASIVWRTLLPPAGSTLPQSKIFSDRLRRIAFDSIRSLTAAARYSSSVSRTSSSFAWRQVDGHALEVEALPDLAPDLVERVAQLLLVEVADDVER